MKDCVVDITAPFRGAAETAEAAEKAFRASFRPRLEALEQARVFACRRMNLVGGMAQAASGGETREEAVMAVLDMAAGAFALERGRERHEAILEQLRPVAEAVATTVHPAPEAETPPDLTALLARFEAWYQDRTGSPFLARAGIVVPETPLVDW